MMACVRKHLGPSKKPLADLIGLHFTVTDEGRLQTWAGHEADMLHPELDRSMHRTHTAVQQALAQQGGVDKAARGCWSKEWRQLLMTEGELPPEEAMELCKGLHTIMRGGLHSIWDCRCELRHRLVKSEQLTLQF